MLISNLFTFLCIKEGEIYQSNMCDYDENREYIALISDLNSLGYRTIFLNDRTISFRKTNSGFLVVNSDGSCGCDLELPFEGVFKVRDGYIPLQVEKLEEGISIPKIIHQTDSSASPRSQFSDNIAYLKSVNSDFVYQYHNEPDMVTFIQTNYGSDVLDRYQRINPKYGAAKADLFRYLLMYKIGGVYLDMKSSCETSFNEIIDDDSRMVLSHWKYLWGGNCSELTFSPLGEYQQWFMISKPGESLVKRIIDQVLSNIDLYDSFFNGTGKPGTLRLTGPIAFTRAIWNHRNETNSRIENAGELGLIYQSVSNYTRVNDYTIQEEPIVR